VRYLHRSTAVDFHTDEDVAVAVAWTMQSAIMILGASPLPGAPVTPLLEFKVVVLLRLAGFLAQLKECS